MPWKKNKSFFLKNYSNKSSRTNFAFENMKNRCKCFLMNNGRIIFEFSNNSWLNIISFSFWIKFSSICLHFWIKLVDRIEQIVLYVMDHEEDFLQMVHQLVIQSVHMDDEDVSILDDKLLLEQSKKTIEWNCNGLPNVYLLYIFILYFQQ
jgi:hypothetical protein